MEFKNVVIVNCNEDNIPYSKSDEGINIEEERRLFLCRYYKGKRKLIFNCTKGYKGEE